MKKNLNKIYVFAFLFLYLLVAAISFCHAIEFFSIGNVQWMSVTLAFAFELGLFVCLSSILLGTNKDNTIAWLLLIILVIVQVCGNTYSVFKYISLSETEYYQYLAKPLLFWIEEVSEETVQVIISWIMGAILPIVALLMTEMVSKTIKGEEVSVDKEEMIEEKKIDTIKVEPKRDVPSVKKEINEVNIPPKNKEENHPKDQQNQQKNQTILAEGDIGRTKEQFNRK
jgi:hypothetical protein